MDASIVKKNRVDVISLMILYIYYTTSRTSIVSSNITLYFLKIDILQTSYKKIKKNLKVPFRVDVMDVSNALQVIIGSYEVICVHVKSACVTIRVDALLFGR